MNYTKLQIDDTVFYKVEGDYVGNKPVYWDEKGIAARVFELNTMISRHDAYLAELSAIESARESEAESGDDNDKIDARKYGVNI